MNLHAVHYFFDFSKKINVAQCDTYYCPICHIYLNNFPLLIFLLILLNV